MAQKIDLSSYFPFQHSNFDYIRNSINIARNQKTETIEGALSSTLIYVNAVEYVASHLLENLCKIEYLVIRDQLNGIVFRKDLEKKKIPLEGLIKELKKFEFPDKQSFIEDLGRFKDLRNKYTHNLLSLDKKELQLVDDELMEMRLIAERLLTTYDLLVKGIGMVWDNYITMRNTKLETINSANAKDDKEASKTES